MRVNAQLEPPPKRGMSCFGRGCLILIVIAILLVVVGVGGSFWGVRHVYLSDKPAPIPEAPAPTETSPAPGETSAPAPSERSAEVRERLDTMKKAARAHERTGVELTAADINSLIAANRKSRGTASVGINDTALQAQFSIPLQRLDVPFRNALGLGNRYLNATVSITAPPGTNASNVQLSDVTLNGHSDFRRFAGLAITRSRKIAANLRDQICQQVRSNRRRNQGRQSDPVHERPLIVLTTRMCIRPNLSREHVDFSLANKRF